MQCQTTTPRYEVRGSCAFLRLISQCRACQLWRPLRHIKDSGSRARSTLIYVVSALGNAR
eukprot:1221511-Rhodomonas_salina.1